MTSDVANGCAGEAEAAPGTESISNARLALWGGRPPDTVLGEMVVDWRRGAGFAIWGQELVQMWAHTLVAAVRVPVPAETGGVVFVEQYIHSQCIPSEEVVQPFPDGF
jgi:hypothetical protein